MKIAIFQSVIPHYREYLFKSLATTNDLQIFLYGKYEVGLKTVNLTNTSRLKSLNLGPFTIFTSPLLYKYDIVILQGNMWHLTNWLIILWYKLFNTKILLFGHGISCTNYSKEINKPKLVRRLFHRLSDGLIFYTNDVAVSYNWRVPCFVMNNTLSLKENTKEEVNIDDIKIKFLVMTRFNSEKKRGDLLNDFILKLPENKFEFHIIGDGDYLHRIVRKNITYYGALYEESKINSLFNMCDCFVHLAWTGLSIVQALANAKGVITLSRSNKIYHSVEFEYLKSDFSIIEDNIDELVDKINVTSKKSFRKMGDNAFKYYKNNLLPEEQIKNLNSFFKILKKNN
jgi:glycosyltransferase involved in cell wall biosynthesis